MATTSSYFDDDYFDDLFDDLPLCEALELEIWKALGVEIYEYPYTVKDYPFTVEGVYGFLNDNSFNAADLSDIMFGVIVVKLVDLKLIVPNDKSAFDLSDKNAQQNIPEVLDEAKLEMFSSFAKTMIFVALHVHCKGKFDAESDAFYKSFCSAKGPLLAQSKFNTILEMLISSRKFRKITKIITVGDIKSDTDVFKHKLTWFPTPGLVKKALIRFPIMEIHDSVAVRDYINFDKAGILAYVASGPLAQYCKGGVDVMEVGVENIPEDLPLCALQAIKLPYHKATIKKAYIILKVTRYEFGLWHQGEKAMRHVYPADLKFRAIVRAVMKAVVQKFAADAKTDQDDSQTSSQEGGESSGAIQKSATNPKIAVDVSETSSQDGGESQGENAMRPVDPAYLKFSAIVRAVMKAVVQKFAADAKTDQDDSQTSSQEGGESSGAIQKSATNPKTAVDVSESSSQDGGESSGAIQKSATNPKIAVDVSETSSQDGGESSGYKI